MYIILCTLVGQCDIVVITTKKAVISQLPCYMMQEISTGLTEVQSGVCPVVGCACGQTEQISVSMLASCSILPLNIMYRQNCYQLSYSDLTHKATEYTLAPQTSHYFWIIMLAWRSMPSVRYKYITSRCAIIGISISCVV